MSLQRKIKRIAFLLPYPVGVAPGQRFRFEQYIGLLRTKGFDVSLLPFLSTRSNELLYQPGQYVKKALGVMAGFFRRAFTFPRVVSADWIFIFREATPLGPPLFEWLLTRVFRKKVIYDFDDAIWIANTSAENRMAAGLKFHSKVASICKWSYRISCGNEFLAAFARKHNAKVVVVPTTIDTQNEHYIRPFATPRESNKVVIGWTGTHSTLFYLEPLVPVLESLFARHDHLRFLVIADRKPGWQLRNLEFLPWNKETEIEDLCKIDIGVMPLSDDDWSRGKCGFKALQYMSLEKPALVSPVGVNTKIVDHGINGYHCSNPAEWMANLETLINDPGRRERMGKAGREKVIKDYSVVSNAANFLGLFE